MRTKKELEGHPDISDELLEWLLASCYLCSRAGAVGGCPVCGAVDSISSGPRWFADMGLDEAQPFLVALAEALAAPPCPQCNSMTDTRFGTIPSNGFGSRFLSFDLRCLALRCGFADRKTLSLENAWTVATVLKKLRG